VSEIPVESVGEEILRETKWWEDLRKKGAGGGVGI